jgi:hypothetical protein
VDAVWLSGINGNGFHGVSVSFNAILVSDFILAGRLIQYE